MKITESKAAKVFNSKHAPVVQTANRLRRKLHLTLSNICNLHAVNVSNICTVWLVCGLPVRL